MTILNGCKAVSYKQIDNLILPDFPKANIKVSEDFAKCCQDNNCKHLNNWINQLYLFKQEYEIIRNSEE